MTVEKTSIWIGRLSSEGRQAMHSFLVFFNTGKMDDIIYNLSTEDTSALSIVVGRLQLQNSIEKVNMAISDFNQAKHLKLELIKE